MASEERKEAFLRAWFDAPEGSHWAHGMSNEVEQGVSDCFDKAIAAWNADAPISPDATGKCGELVTVETQFRMTDRTDRPWGNGPIPEYLNGYAVSRELVTRSQAAELLAEKDAQIAGWMESGELWAAEIRELQADNAAQAARIKELESAWSEEFAKRGRAEASEGRALARVADLEAKLAAAEKALEPFADIADLIDAETEGMAETDELVLHFHDYEFAKWPVSFFRKARAARGGKPS